MYSGHGINFIIYDFKVFKFSRSKYHEYLKAKHNPRKDKMYESNLNDFF
jgi:ribosomal protein L24E